MLQKARREREKISLSWINQNDMLFTRAYRNLRVIDIVDALPALSA